MKGFCILGCHSVHSCSFCIYLKVQGKLHTAVRGGVFERCLVPTTGSNHFFFVLNAMAHNNRFATTSRLLLMRVG